MKHKLLALKTSIHYLPPALQKIYNKAHPGYKTKTQQAQTRNFIRKNYNLSAIISDLLTYIYKSKTQDKAMCALLTDFYKNYTDSPRAFKEFYKACGIVNMRKLLLIPYVKPELYTSVTANAFIDLISGLKECLSPKAFSMLLNPIGALSHKSILSYYLDIKPNTTPHTIFPTTAFNMANAQNPKDE